MLAVFYAYGAIDSRTLAEGLAIVISLIVAFYGLFASGLNLRFRDPSLTTWQLLGAVFTMS